jgi:cyclase
MRDYEVPKRVMPCLDVHDGRVVKGEQFENLHDAGDPIRLAQQYEADGADEIVFLDISATQEKRETATAIAKRAAKNLFIPFTIGGGVRSVADAQSILDSGADKITVNSAGLERPSLLTELANHIGRQSVTLSIDAKRSEDGTTWEAYIAGGKKPSGKDAIAWAKEGVKRGAGEILLTSIDCDGKNEGYDIELTEKVVAEVNVPVIASGGAGRVEHLSAAIQESGADAVLCASTLHRGELSIQQIKSHFSNMEIMVRPIDVRTTDYYQSPETVSGRPHLAIIDYGMGNRNSVMSALSLVGADVAITDNAEEIAEADGIVLPGVGSFPAAMARLEEQDLIKSLNEFRTSGKPVLGICLGYQLLFEGSDEHTPTEGLGWIPGNVTEIDTTVSPNIGWRFVDLRHKALLTQGLNPEELFYHAHQFAAKPNDPDSVTGVTRLGESRGGQAALAVSIVKDRAIYGTQFHPEKSSYAGLSLLKNFVDICRNNP